jgi:hypothetical protein
LLCPHTLLKGEIDMTIALGRPAVNRTDAKTMEVSIHKLLSHTLLLGKTGQGKSNAEKQIMKGILAESVDGKKVGFTYIDPHGDDIKHICSIIPKEMKDRVHILHFGHSNYPRGINILEVGKDPQDMSSRIVGMIREVFAGETGNRMDHYMRYGLMTLGSTPNQSILGFESMFNDKQYRDKLAANLTDPALKSFWSTDGQFSRNTSKITDILAPVLQKLSIFTMHPSIRAVFGQNKSTINIRQIIQDGDILLIDLSALNHEMKELVGTIIFHLFHSELVKRFETSRFDDRMPHFLFTNELSYYPTSIFSTLLKEGRKYGLGIVTSLQSFDRISGHLASEIVNSVGTYLAFNSGIGDATRISKALNNIEPNNITQLPRFHFIARSSNGRGEVEQEVMSFNEIEPIDHNPYDILLAASDLRDGRSIVEVNKEIGEYL